MKHFNYVKPRWESSNCPRRRVCHLVVPIALLLAVTAADKRTTAEERRRQDLSVMGRRVVHRIKGQWKHRLTASDSRKTQGMSHVTHFCFLSTPLRILQTLDRLRPRLFVEIGVSSDWGAEFLRLIRLLEPDNHDPALLYEQVSHWFERQRLLFQELHILHELPRDGPDAQSATFHAVTNAMQCPPLCVNGRTFFFGLLPTTTRRSLPRQLNACPTWSRPP